MIAPILVAFVALTPICRATAFARPFILTFYDDNKGPTTWTDEDSIEASTDLDDGQLSHANDSSYVGHFTFIATEDRKRRFYWKPGDRAAKTLSWNGQAAVTCDVGVSGDPGIEDLVYNLGTGTFKFPPEAKPNLGVLHVRCLLPDAPVTEESGDTFLPDSVSRPPHLNETDFERGLEIIFHISGQTYTSVSDMKSRINTDFQWTALPDKLTTAQDLRWEDHVGSNARRNYQKLRDSVDNLDFTDEDLDKSQWHGEIGRMVFSRARDAPREFMWTLHNRPGEISLQKCRIKVDYDLHGEKAIVHMDEGFKIELQLSKGERAFGDPKGASVTCDKLVVDEGPRPSMISD